MSDLKINVNFTVNLVYMRQHYHLKSLEVDLGIFYESHQRQPARTLMQGKHSDKSHQVVLLGVQILKLCHSSI